MIPSRQVVVAAASIFTAIAAMPSVVRAEDKAPANNSVQDTDKDKDKDKKRHESKGRSDEQRGEKRQPHAGQNSKGEKTSGFKSDDRQTPENEPKKFGNQPPNGGPNSWDKRRPAVNTMPPKPPVMNESTQTPPGNFPKTQGPDGKFKAEDQNKPGLRKHYGDRDDSTRKPPVVNETTQTPPGDLPKTQGPDGKSKAEDQNKPGFRKHYGDRDKDDNAKKPPATTFSKTPPPYDKFKAEDKNQPNSQNHFGDKDKNQGPTDKPVVVNPAPSTNPATPGLATTPPKALSAGDARKRFENLRSARKEKVEAGGSVVIEEPGRRMFKQNNRLVIQHDETERLRKVAPNAHFQKGAGGTTVSIIDRPGNVKIYSETDANGQLLRRYRRGPEGRDVIIIDNRRRRGHGVGRDIAIGAGIGLGVVAGAAILNSFVDVPEPRVRIPREKYIVEYDNASEDDVYDALSAPPIEDFRDRYTLDEIRATARLRDRMRRVDLDDINFEFGSWDVDPSEYHKLERIARAMMRVVRRNPNEVFLIEGYTDAVGSNEDNLSLSDRRAESVAEVLSQQFQVPFENLTTQGYGEDYLKVPTNGPERLNRRVAVRRITPLLARGDGLPPPSARSDSRDGGYDDRGDGPDNADGPQDDQGPSDQGDGRGYEYRPYNGTNPD